MPVTAPVPEEYAKKYDANTPTTYGNYQVSTGPYRFQAGGSNKITYHVGKSATLSNAALLMTICRPVEPPSGSMTGSRRMPARA